MAVDTYDPVTGAPQFADGGAPDLGVDPTAVGAYAADVGNRIVRANLAALNAYPYKRKGLSGYALDTGIGYVHDAAGWVQSTPGPWVDITEFGAGWSATAGYTPQVRRDGNRVQIRGAVTLGAGSFANMFTVPDGFRASVQTWLGVSQSSALGVSGMLLLTVPGLVTVPGNYRAGSPTAGNAFPLVGTWYTD